MKQTPLEHKITDIARPVIEDLGYNLVCVKIIGEGGSQNIQVMAENPKTKRLGIDDCTKISKALSAIMDVEDPINGAYRLEISSPGIDRPLIRLEDFETYKNLEVKIETSVPSENGQKRFRGMLKGIENEDQIALSTDQGDINIPYTSLSKAKLVLTDELIKATANL